MSAKSRLGRSVRTGVSVVELSELTPNEETAIIRFEVVIWQDGRTCLC